MIVAKNAALLACLLSQGSTMSQVDPNGVLSESEKAHIMAMAEQEPCLPEALETHVKDTEDKIQNGELKFDVSSVPTRECGYD